VNTYYLFGATFGVVFMLGFQSLSVQSGNYPLAAINSIIIGIFNLALLKTVPFVDAPVQIAVYIIAGPIGIVASMLVHRKIVTPWRERSAMRRGQA
jgi:uncharacterized membrane protein YuzA (DUF378 family)